MSRCVGFSDKGSDTWAIWNVKTPHVGLYERHNYPKRRPKKDLQTVE